MRSRFRSGYKSTVAKFGSYKKKKKKRAISSFGIQARLPKKKNKHCFIKESNKRISELSSFLNHQKPLGYYLIDSPRTKQISHSYYSKFIAKKKKKRR